MSALGPQFSGLFYRGLGHAVRNRGGFSVDAEGYGPASGHMVSNFEGEERTPVSDFHQGHIEDYQRRHWGEISASPAMFHGAWKEGDHVYQDVSRRFENPGQAYVHMVANNQAADFNIVTNQSRSNLAYELPDDSTRRRARSTARMAGLNVGGTEESARAMDLAQGTRRVQRRRAAGPRQDRSPAA